MTLDENFPAWEHGRLRGDYSRSEFGIDDGSSEAEGAMLAEYKAAHPDRHRDDERVPTLHAELVDDGLIAEPDWTNLPW